MIRNDLHVHSIQSACGFHTLLEIVQIAARKGIRAVNISDHGPASGRNIRFGVFLDRNRLPESISFGGERSVIVLRGIEANILDIEGNTDIPLKHISEFDLISIGFHKCCKLTENGSETQNIKALINTLKKYPFDLLTHPCIAAFPLDMPVVIDLAKEYDFALEINNTKLRLKKTNLGKLEEMIHLAVKNDVNLMETSDGHTFLEIGENDEIERFLAKTGYDGNQILLNRHDEKLDEFIASRKKRR
jgi:putative hydrolase